MLKSILKLENVQKLDKKQQRIINGAGEAYCRTCPVDFFCCGYGCFDPASVLFNPCL